MLRWVLALVAVVVSLVALEAGAIAEEGAADDGATTSGVAEHADAIPWYSMFKDNRTEQFADLRSERSKLTKELTSLEAELRDLRQKTVDLQESQKQVAIEGSAVFSIPALRSSSIDSWSEERKRLEFEHTQRTEEATSYVADANVELARLKQSGAANTDEGRTRLDELSRRIKATEDELKQNAARYEFDKGLLDEKIRRADEDRVAIEAKRKKIADERNAQADELQKQVATNEALISQKSARLTELYSQIDAVDAEIMKLIDVGDADGWFKIIISLSFALLVGGVILGFFVVIRGDKGTVSAIFSADAGIQFVTIFSIIIAVILFGIIGVLEGKELSALLGGLSGYILGRSSVASRSASQNAAGTTGTTTGTTGTTTGATGATGTSGAAGTTGTTGAKPVGT